MQGWVYMLENINENSFELYELDGICYISKWSNFMLKEMPDSLQNMSVCDFGAGTGVLGIAAARKGAKMVFAIEKDQKFIPIMKKNYKLFYVRGKIRIEDASTLIYKNVRFDYIFSNPSCYPSEVETASFYNAGELGLDMIIEVIKFASKTLKSGGHLFLLTPSIVPMSIVFNELKCLNLCAKKINEKFVPLRNHLRDKIKCWVDLTSIKYPEMQYFEKDSELYERVDLYDIQLIY